MSPATRPCPKLEKQKAHLSRLYFFYLKYKERKTGHISALRIALSLGIHGESHRGGRLPPGCSRKLPESRASCVSRPSSTTSTTDVPERLSRLPTPARPLLPTTARTPVVIPSFLFPSSFRQSLFLQDWAPSAPLRTKWLPCGDFHCDHVQRSHR